MVLGGLRRDLAAPLELGDERVVAGELRELAVAHAVRPAVAHVGEAHLVAVHLGERERGAHAAARLVGNGEVVDAPVGVTDDAGELRLGRLAGLARSLHRLDGHRGGHLAGLGAAHAVRDREQRRADGERVLVRGPLAPHVGAPGLLDDAKRHPLLLVAVFAVADADRVARVSGSADCTLRPFRCVPFVDPMSSRYRAPPRS